MFFPSTGASRLSVSTGSDSDRLRRPGRRSRESVAHQPEQSGQSQSGGDEGGGASLLPGRPGHLAQGSHRLPHGVVKGHTNHTEVVQRREGKSNCNIIDPTR